MLTLAASIHGLFREQVLPGRAGSARFNNWSGLSSGAGEPVVCDVFKSLLVLGVVQKESTNPLVSVGDQEILTNTGCA